MITLRHMLSLKSDLLETARVKLVRHKDSRQEFRHITKNRDALLEYQKEQGKDIFGDCDYIASFIGIERRRSVFLGVFKVGKATRKNGLYLYDLEEVDTFSDFVDRLVINWGDNTRAWHQWYDRNDKEVIELLPAGYIGNFPGLLEFTLDYAELCNLINNPDANPDWKHQLSAVNGIYMILDTNTGQQYIGSANGENGIWQRWCEYAANGTGGNKQLKELLARDPAYAQHFRFSVLQTLPANISRNEIVAIENLYKNKMGSRVYGLNSN